MPSWLLHQLKSIVASNNSDSIMDAVTQYKNKPANRRASAKRGSVVGRMMKRMSLAGGFSG